MRRSLLTMTSLALVFWGNPLLEAASPKAASHLRPVSAARSAGVIQGMPVHTGYGGDMVYEGGDCCGASAPVCGVACGPCCPPLIPALVHGIDCLLKKVFCCQPCCNPCGVAACCGVPSYRFGDGCGCDPAMPGYEETILPGGHSDPFVDDPMPPAAAARGPRGYRLWNMPQPTPARPVTARSVTARASIPRQLAVTEARPLEGRSKPANSNTSRPAPGNIRATSGDSGELRMPHNPLRN